MRFEGGQHEDSAEYQRTGDQDRTVEEEELSALMGEKEDYKTEEEITEEILNNYTYKNNHPDPQRSELIQIMTTPSLDEFSWNSLTNGITWYIMPSSMPTESGIILIGRLTFKSNINGTGIYTYNRQNYQFNIVNGRIQ